MKVRPDGVLGQVCDKAGLGPLPIGGDLESSGRAKRFLQYFGKPDPAEPVTADFPFPVGGDQIPAASPRHQAEGVDCPRLSLSVRPFVIDPKFSLLPDRLQHGSHPLGFSFFPSTVPDRCGCGPTVFGPGVPRGGEVGEQFLPGDPKGPVDAQIPQKGSPGKGRNREAISSAVRVSKVFRYSSSRRHPPFFPVRHHGDSQGAEGVQIPQNGPAGHLQLLRQFSCGDLSPLLQKERRASNRSPTHGHLPFLFLIMTKGVIFRGVA